MLKRQQDEILTVWAIEGGICENRYESTKLDVQDNSVAVGAPVCVIISVGVEARNCFQARSKSNGREGVGIYWLVSEFICHRDVLTVEKSSDELWGLGKSEKSQHRQM